MSDFNTAIKNWLITCPDIQADKLFFNFLDTADGNKTLTTVTESTTEDIVGNKIGKYTFGIIAFNALNGMAVYYNDDDIDIVTNFTRVNDWIRLQNERHNYPVLGTKIVVENISVLPTPVFNGAELSENMIIGKYMIQAEISYTQFI